VIGASLAGSRFDRGESMIRMVVVAALCLAHVAVAAEPLTSPVDTQSLQVFLDQARNLVVEKIDGVKPTDLRSPYLAPYYASRTSDSPAGTLVCFTVRGSHRKEERGEMEDRILVIFREEREPEVKRIQIWLSEGIIGATR